jgi:hypothetical protein
MRVSIDGLWAHQHKQENQLEYMVWKLACLCTAYLERGWLVCHHRCIYRGVRASKHASKQETLAGLFLMY